MKDVDLLKELENMAMNVVDEFDGEQRRGCLMIVSTDGSGYFATPKLKP